MEKAEEMRKMDSSWLEEIKAKYNVDHEDFTEHYPHGIIVYRGSSLQPEVVFTEGFKQSSDPIWIEDSRYLLKDRQLVHRYVQDQKKLNRTLIPDETHTYITPPGATRGLISTTFSSRKAIWYVSQSFLERAKAKVYPLYDQMNDYNIRMNMCRAQLEGYFTRTTEVKDPIGYVYAFRITQGINISAHFQWADLPDPNLIEQEIACLEIPATDILFARPITMALVSGQGLVCSPGAIVQNQVISDELQPLVSLSRDINNFLEIGFDNELQHFKTTQFAGRIGIHPNSGEFIFSYYPENTISLDDGNFSTYFIKPHIADSKAAYLRRLKERLNGVDTAQTALKRLKHDEHKISKEQYPLRLTDNFADNKDADHQDLEAQKTEQMQDIEFMW